MFRFTQLARVHLEITNNCQASCPMCSRNIHGGLDNPLIKVNNWTLAEFQTVMSPQVLRQIDLLSLCGNFGDPIVNKDLDQMCRYTKETNPQINLRVHTNGSARPVEFWSGLADALPARSMVVFALDGLRDTHVLYRIGTDFDTIIRNARAFIEAGGAAEWVFLKFKHNEHQVHEARQMAQELGFEKFTVKNSSRFILEPKFDVVDKSGAVRYAIEPASDVPLKFIDRKMLQAYDRILAASVISCQALENREVYIDAYRNAYPCCWLAIPPYDFIDQGKETAAVQLEILNQYNDLVASLGGLPRLSTLSHSLEEIIESPEYQSVWETYWTTKKLIVCAKTCGRAPMTDFAQPRDQQTEVVSLTTVMGRMRRAFNRLGQQWFG